MKVLVDTCGWIEWLTDGPVAGRFESYLRKPGNLVVPTIIQYELYRWICRERDEATALEVIGITGQGQVVPLDTPLSLLAADFAAQHRLAMADAIVYACAQQVGVRLISSDGGFEKLPGVTYLTKN